MPSPHETPCPIDEHGCQNPDCLLYPYFPSCLQAGHALAPALAFLESVKKPLNEENRQMIKDITELLGVDYGLFLEYLDNKIQDQKPK
jgi:hypothetical protein